MIFVWTPNHFCYYWFFGLPQYGKLYGIEHHGLETQTSQGNLKFLYEKAILVVTVTQTIQQGPEFCKRCNHTKTNAAKLEWPIMRQTGRERMESIQCFERSTDENSWENGTGSDWKEIQPNDK